MTGGFPLTEEETTLVVDLTALGEVMRVVEVLVTVLNLSEKT